MASLVSSERAFSSAGITISKCCNWLKGDIVEALQCMKMVYRSDLMFREIPLLKELEQELEDLEPYISGEDDEWEDVNDFEQIVIDEDEDNEDIV
jgi:hypothetical protein